jgi:hypothetical protein
MANNEQPISPDEGFKTDFKAYEPYRVDLDTISQDASALQSFNGKILAMSESVRDIFFDATTTTFFIDMANKYDFSKNQSAELSRIVRDVLLGDLFIGDMPQMILTKLKLPPEQAKEITNQIITVLFAPAIAHIKVMQKEKFPDRIAQVVASAQPQNPAQQQPIPQRPAPPQSQPQMLQHHPRPVGPPQQPLQSQGQPVSNQVKMPNINLDNVIDLRDNK